MVKLETSSVVTVRGSIVSLTPSLMTILLPYFYGNSGILLLNKNTDTKLHKELGAKLADRNKSFPMYEPYDLPVADFKEDHWT